MKQHLLFNLRALLVLCMIFVIGGGSLAFAEEVTYTVSSTSEVTITGSAPKGSSATYSSTYNTKWQLTGGNKMTLTLSGYAGKKITGLTMSMKSNKDSGAGYLDFKAGKTSLATIGSSSNGIKFNNSAWHGSWSTSYVDVDVTMSNDSYAIQDGDEVVIVLGATANSLYCQHFKLTYVDAVSVNYTISWKVNGKTYSEGNPSTQVIGGEKVTTLPTAPSAINDKVFVGWTNAEIVSSQNEKPSVLFTSAEESPIVTNNTIYYAVFAKQDGEGISSEELTGTEILNLGTLAYDTEKTYSSSSLKYVIHGYKNNEKYPWIQLKSAMGSYIKITAPQNITKVDFTITSATNSKDGITDISKHNPFAGTVELVTSDCEFSETSENIGSTSEISNNEATINTTSGSNAKEVYIKVSKGARIWGITTYYSSVQYSGYTTKVSEPSTPATHTLTLVAKDNDTYYATFSNNEPVLFPTDVEVDAVSVTGNTMHITAMESTKGTYNVKTDLEGSSASVGNLYYVPANTGVLIQSRTNSVTYYYPYSSETVSYTETNQLKPAPAGGGEFAPEAGHVYYKLAYNDYSAKTGLGFYWGAENGGAFSVKAGTAYLAVPTTEGSGAKAFTLAGGVVTGISSVNVESNRTKTIYNIAGQRVYDMTKSGLYIVDGKKVVVK